MIRMNRLFRLGLMLPVLALGLAACSNPPRYTVDPPLPAERMNSAARTILLRDVSLPEYAAAPEIAMQQADGSVLNVSRALWADDPVRGWSNALARQLDARLTATVAAEPWPLSGLPDAEVSVRVARALAGADGVYRLDGQYYVLSDRAGLGPRSAGFTIAVPLSGSDAAAIAAAQSKAVAQLAQVIATGMAR